MARSRARRLVLMYRLRMAGVLEHLTLRQIGKVTGVSRATVLRDLQELDEAEEEFRELMGAEPWKQWEPAAEFVRDEDEQVAAVKRLLRDGLVWLQHWVVPKDAES